MSIEYNPWSSSTSNPYATNVNNTTTTNTSTTNSSQSSSTTTQNSLPVYPMPNLGNAAATKGPEGTTKAGEGKGYVIYKWPNGKTVRVENGVDARKLVESKTPNNAFVTNIVDYHVINFYLNAGDSVPENIIAVNAQAPDGSKVAAIYSKTNPSSILEGDFDRLAFFKYMGKTADASEAPDSLKNGWNYLTGGIKRFQTEPMLVKIPQSELGNYDLSELIKGATKTILDNVPFSQVQQYQNKPGYTIKEDGFKTTVVDSRTGLTQAQFNALVAANPNWVKTNETIRQVLDKVFNNITDPARIQELKDQGFVLTQTGVNKETETKTNLTAAEKQALEALGVGWMFTERTITKPGETLTRTGVSEEVKNQLLLDGWEVKDSRVVTEPGPTQTKTGVNNQTRLDLESKGWVVTRKYSETVPGPVETKTVGTEAEYKALLEQGWELKTTNTSNGEPIYANGVDAAERDRLLALGYTLKDEHTTYVPTGNTINLGPLTPEQLAQYQANPELYPNLRITGYKTETHPGQTVTEMFKVDNKVYGVWSELIDAGDGDKTLTSAMANGTYNDPKYKVNNLFTGAGNLNGQDMLVDGNTDLDDCDKFMFAGDPVAKDIGGYENGEPDDTHDVDVHPGTGYYNVIQGGNSDFNFSVNQRIQQIDAKNNPDAIAATEYGYVFNYEGGTYKVHVNDGVVNITHPNGETKQLKKGEVFKLPENSSEPLLRIETSSAEFAGHNGAAEDRLRITFMELPDDQTYQTLLDKGFTHEQILDRAANQHVVTHGFRVPEDDADGAYGPHSGGVSQPLDETDDCVKTYYDSDWALCKPDKKFTYTTTEEEECEIPLYGYDEVCPKTTYDLCITPEETTYTLCRETEREVDRYDMKKETTVERKEYDLCKETTVEEKLYDAKRDIETPVFKAEKFKEVKEISAELKEKVKLYDVCETEYSKKVSMELQKFDARVVSPIAFDLNGDGLKTTANHKFDFDGDGTDEYGAWVDNNDGVLVMDLNNDGKINGIGETLGDKFNGGNFDSGYDALLDYIKNSTDVTVQTYDDDGVLTADEMDALGLKVLVNGKLLSASEAGIEKMSLSYEASDKIDDTGTQHALVGEYWRAGQTTPFTMADLFFPYSEAEDVSQATRDAAMPVDAEAEPPELSTVTPPDPNPEPAPNLNDYLMQQFAAQMLGNLINQTYTKPLQQTAPPNPLASMDFLTQQALMNRPMPAQQQFNSYMNMLVMMYTMMAMMRFSPFGNTFGGPVPLNSNN